MTRRAWLGVALAVLAGAARAQETRPGGRAPTDGVGPGAAATRPAEKEILLRAPHVLRDRLEFAIEPDSLPRLLVVRGRRVPGANAAFEINGEVWGTAAGFEAGLDLFDAAMPLPPSQKGSGRIAFAVRPGAPGVTLERVDLVPASRVRFVIRDQAEKNAIPGVATLDRVDGREPSPSGPLGGWPRERASWISSDGHGDLYVPAGAAATFSARSTPFRGVDVQEHAIGARDNLLLNFLMPADQLPAGAVILEGPPRPGVAPDVLLAADRARGIGKRPKGIRAVPADEILARGSAAIEEAMAHPDVRFLVTNEAGSRLVVPSPFVTVELPGGDLLHSNGPVILLVDLRREGRAVRAFVKVRLPAGVIADRLFVWAGATKSEHVISGPSTIPMDVIAPPRSPIALVVTGPARRPESPLDRAAAFRIFLAP